MLVWLLLGGHLGHKASLSCTKSIPKKVTIAENRCFFKSQSAKIASLTAEKSPQKIARKIAEKVGAIFRVAEPKSQRFRILEIAALPGCYGSALDGEAVIRSLRANFKGVELRLSGSLLLLSGLKKEIIAPLFKKGGWALDLFKPHVV